VLTGTPREVFRQQELLQSIGLDVPEAAKLAHALRAEGFDLPEKFGYDKRKCYLSNEVLVGTVSREAAIRELETAAYDKETMRADTAFIANKLGVSDEEFERILHGENKTYADYRNSWWVIRLGTVILRALGAEKKKFR